MAHGDGRQIGLFAATMLVAGNMIGSGVFLMPAAMAGIGTVSVLGWVVAVPGALLFAFVFARLSGRLPLAGGPYAWTYQSLGPFPAFGANMLYWLGNVIGNIAIAVSVAGYLSVFVPALRGAFPAALAAIAALWLTTLINIVGPRMVALLESGTTMLGLLPIVLVGVLGWLWFSPDLFAAGWNPSDLPTLGAASHAVALMFWAFTGFESAAVAAAVVRDPARNVPRATVLGVAVSAVVYVLATCVVLGIVPIRVLAATEAPFAEAVTLMIGGIGAGIFTLCAIIKATGALGGWTLLVAETAKAAANDGLFPTLFGRTDRRGVPIANFVILAIVSTGVVLLTLSPTVGGLFGRLVDVSTLLLLPPYILGAVVLARLESGIMRIAGLLAALYGIWVVSTIDAASAALALIVVLLTSPLFLFTRYGRAAHTPDASTDAIAR